MPLGICASVVRGGRLGTADSFPEPSASLDLDLWCVKQAGFESFPCKLGMQRSGPWKAPFSVPRSCVSGVPRWLAVGPCCGSVGAGDAGGGTHGLLLRHESKVSGTRATFPFAL